jgi:hypothetical protein
VVEQQSVEPTVSLYAGFVVASRTSWARFGLSAARGSVAVGRVTHERPQSREYHTRSVPRARWVSPPCATDDVPE